MSWRITKLKNWFEANHGFAMTMWSLIWWNIVTPIIWFIFFGTLGLITILVMNVLMSFAIELLNTIHDKEKLNEEFRTKQNRSIL